MRIVVATVLGATLSLSTDARAELTAFWRYNPITPDAIADDPALAGMQSWSLMVTNSEGGFVWGGMRATLPADNHFYRNVFGGSFRPSSSDVIAHPALQFHTYVDQPRPSGLALISGFPESSPLSFGGPLDPIPGTFSVLWHDVFELAHPPGTFEIARLTFPSGVLPAIHPESHTLYSEPWRSAPVPPIPEPATSIAVLGAAMGWILARRDLFCCRG